MVAAGRRAHCASSPIHRFVGDGPCSSPLTRKYSCVIPACHQPDTNVSRLQLHAFDPEHGFPTFTESRTMTYRDLQNSDKPDVFGMNVAQASHTSTEWNNGVANVKLAFTIVRTFERGRGRGRGRKEERPVNLVARHSHRTAAQSQAPEYQRYYPLLSSCYPSWSLLACPASSQRSYSCRPHCCLRRDVVTSSSLRQPA